MNVEEEDLTGAVEPVEAEETPEQLEAETPEGEQPEEAGAEPEKHEDGDWSGLPEWAQKRNKALVAQRNRTREKLAEAETERETLKSETETLRKRYGDQDVLAAAKRTGLFPELLSPEEAKLLTQAETLQAQIDAYEDHPDGFTAANGQEVSAEQVRKWRREATRELNEIRDEAVTLRTTKARELKEIFALGMAAKRKGLKPAEADRPGARETPPKASPTEGRRSAEGATPPRRSVTGAQPVRPALSEVKTRADLLRAL